MGNGCSLETEALKEAWHVLRLGQTVRCPDCLLRPLDPNLPLFSSIQPPQHIAFVHFTKYLNPQSLSFFFWLNILPPTVPYCPGVVKASLLPWSYFQNMKKKKKP